MYELTGRYGKAKIYATTLEQEAVSQIINLLNQPFIEGEDIAIMPDAHCGVGCTIGYTQTLRNNRICPSLVGVDISCGMLLVKLGKIDIDFEKFDKVVHNYVPSGHDVRETIAVDTRFISELKCYDSLKDIRRIDLSIGSLGGGNHFIELDKDSSGNIYLVIHTGSRNLGKQVAEYYQKAACKKNGKLECDKLVKKLKSEGREKEIEAELNKLRNTFSSSKEYSYLTDDLAKDYLHDMKICEEYARLNRRVIAEEIVNHYLGTSLSSYETIETLHNYIDLEHSILRKGSISLQEGELAIIPINMRDGSLIVRGRGNKDYNFSGPHGAGRLMSRAAAKNNLSLDKYKEEMKNIYSTCINSSTLDESPMAYKDMSEIIENISGTAEIVDIITPIYNFKASE